MSRTCTCKAYALTLSYGSSLCSSQQFTNSSVYLVELSLVDSLIFKPSRAAICLREGNHPVLTCICLNANVCKCRDRDGSRFFCGPSRKEGIKGRMESLCVFMCSIYSPQLALGWLTQLIYHKSKISAERIIKQTSR